jgi:hypothetical protein
MHPGREVGVGIDLIWQYCESDIPGAGASNQAMPVDNSQMVKIFILAILAFALCSCADFKGFHLKPARDDDYDNFGHVPGSGDPS